MEMKILIVEDDQAAFTYLKRIITSQHHSEIYHAENGITALKLLEDDLFDGIISDISMPMMSGLELLEILYSNPKTSGIPVMMTSANNMRSDVEEALRLGAIDYLLKPLMANETLTRVNRFIEVVKCKSVETINRLNNEKKKEILIVTPQKDTWQTVIDNSQNYTIKIISSSPDALQYYLINFPAYVVLDSGLNIMSEDFLAKKIKKLIYEKNSKNVKINTAIVGINKKDNKDLFDVSIESPQQLFAGLENIHKECPV